MDEPSRSQRSSNDSTIIYHFDMEKHSIPFQQFVDTATATTKIVNTFNKQIFGSTEEVDLRIVAPEHGGLIEILEVSLLAGMLTVTTLESDVGKAYIVGLTGREPASWAEDFGLQTRKTMIDDSQLEKHEIDASEILKTTTERDAVSQKVLRKLQAAILADATTRFLEASEERLKKIEFPTWGYTNAFVAKNEIFQACIENEDITALNFDRSKKFQIQKGNFKNYIQKLPTQQKHIQDAPEEPTNREIVEVATVTINSPNWQRNGRGWEGSTETLQSVEFSIEDEEFWKHVETKDTKFGVGDNMTVQWVYFSDSSESTQIRVLKVLMFNGSELAKPLTKQELDRILK